uniref:Uncharacterized protein n=1 Tax=Vombatus ursinus TaxID=29139 RepID=A0A4X2L2G9_VOMUR
MLSTVTLSGISLSIFCCWALLVMYRNAIDLCGFILYTVIMLKLLIISSDLLVDSLGFSKYAIISSAKSDSFVSSLGILIPSISFSSLIAKANISSTVLSNSGDNGHICFTPDLIGKASTFSPLHIMIADGFS